MTINKASIFKVLDAERGKVAEVTPQQPQKIDERLAPYPRDSRGRITADHEKFDPDKTVLTEAGAASTSTFPDLLRAGLRFDAWTSYAETPAVYPMLVREVPSDKQQEEYLIDSPVGTLPIVHEGEPYPEARMSLGEGKIVKNYKRGMIMSVTVEMQKFDQVGKVRELGDLMGRAARLGEEQDVMVALTDTNNYVRAGNTGDNDETAVGNGANTQDLTFSPASLIAAYNILRTMKDRKTGVYYNVMPNTLVVTPKLWWAAQQLIRSPESMRVGGNTTNEIYGMGTKNSFFGLVDTIIVSPQFGNGYQWALMEAGRGLMFQRVEAVQVLQEGAVAENKGYFERDILRYRVRNWYGVGFKTDAFNFYSSSATAPVVS